MNDVLMSRARLAEVVTELVLRIVDGRGDGRAAYDAALLLGRSFPRAWPRTQLFEGGARCATT